MQQQYRGHAPLATRLPLSKFSHTTTAVNSHSRMVWTHINGDGDLYCEIQKSAGDGLSPPSLILRIVHNRRTLEQIDLEHHVRQIKEEPSSSQNGASSKSTFAVVVKLPCLAVKYLLNHTHMRRFQIKFSQDCDYYSTLSIISGINCPLTEGSLPSLRRPPSTVSWASVPTAQITNIPPRETEAVVTPESNAPGLFDHISRTASGFETASNTPAFAPKKAQNPVPGVLQSLSGNNETPVRRSPRHIKALHEEKSPQQAPSRPSTGPIYHDQELNQMLPPKRDLPFVRPKSKVSRADTSSLKSSQQIVPESSYPEPTIKRRESFMSESQSQPLVQTQPYPETMQSSSQNQATLPYPGSNHQTQQPVPGPSVAFMYESQSQPLVQTQPYPETMGPSQYSSQIQATLPYPQSVPQTRQAVPEPSVAVSTKDSQMTGRSNAQNTQVPQSTARSIRKSVEGELSQYVKAPTAERAAFLENWMCELIQDDNFVTLCEDVEGTWRRFAFGMKRSVNEVCDGEL